ncbi:MAG: DUF1800 domain-containing protein [Alphaproteobacteria bacterium]|nr:DUF1800 domain-containing protein [Alphaproteobacteria bacterium]
MSLEGAIAAHRFGLGARAGEIETASQAPKDWLMGQLDGPADQPQALDDQPLQSGGDLVAAMIEFQKQRKALRDAAKDGEVDKDQIKKLNQAHAQLYIGEMAARFAHGFTTDKPFAERFVWFWSNHFTVSSANGRAAPFVGAFEREAIRPHITGTFEEMTQAVVHHPAMLLYLDNAESIGPDSLAGMRSRKGLNENLGRELMELYTLGVDAGYTQADVIALAKLLTGWSIDRNGGGDNGFRFYPARHEPGEFVLRGRTYPPGYDGGMQAVSDLARDPATARHVAKQLAIHFVADDPPASSVARLEKTFNETGGRLKALAQTLVDDPAAWSRSRHKMRTPVEYVTAAYRLMNLPRDGEPPENWQKQVRGAMGATRLMGEFPLAAPSPKGWPDVSEAWSGPDAVLDRIEWARQVGQRLPPRFDAAAVAEMGLGPLVRPATKTAMAQAVTPGEAVALLLSSPEFQRR